jgi:glycosyltransferase involved in cell wall biosynthesis
LKVLTVSHGFPPDQMAGAEIYAYKVSLGLKDRGVDVTVFAPGSRPNAAEYDIVEETVDGLRVMRLNNNFLDLHDLASTYANPDIEAVFEEFLRQEKPDVVHIHHTIGTTANNIAIAKQSGAKVIVTLHDFWFQCARGQRLTPRNHLCTEVQPWRCSLCVGKKRVRYLINYVTDSVKGKTRDQRSDGRLSGLVKFPFRLVGYVWNETALSPITRRNEVMQESLAQADVILAPAQFIADRYVEEGTPEEKIRIWPYGLDEGRFGSADRLPEPRQDGPLRFGFVGTLIPSKGVDLLVSAFQSVSPGQATLEIHGSAAGPNAASYDASLKKLNQHQDLTFHGRFDNKRIVEILSRFDVLIVPSRWFENAPLTLAESVMARLATITTGHGGMLELANNFGNAITFEANSHESLLAAMQKLIDDRALVDSLKAKGAGVRTVADDIDGLQALMADLLQPTLD